MAGPKVNSIFRTFPAADRRGPATSRARRPRGPRNLLGSYTVPRIGTALLKRSPRFLCIVASPWNSRSEEHTSVRQSPCNLVCRLLLEKKKDHLDTSADDLLALPPQLGQRLDRRQRRPALFPIRWPPGADKPIGRLGIFFFFFNDTATTEIYPLSLHDALPIWMSLSRSCPSAWMMRWHPRKIH